MKYIILTVALFMGFTTFAQNLSFSRVIDTVLVVNTGVQQLSGNIIYGDGISPEEGKVWKLHQVITNRDRLGSYIHYCGGGSYTNAGNNIELSLVVDDGNEFATLISTSFLNYNNDDEFVDIMPDNGGNMNPLPLWINSGSTIKPSIHLDIDTNDNLCTVGNTKGRIYVSIIEFDTE